VLILWLAAALRKTIGMGGFVRLGYFAMEASKMDGDLVEFGSWRGLTAMFMSVMSGKTAWIYDSFEGLPEPGPEDISNGNFFKSQFLCDEKEISQIFHEVQLPAPIIHKAWFADLKPQDLPERIAFAHLDGDFYESIKTSLSLVYPRMTTGGLCFIHDYANPNLPGARKAVDEFMADKKERVAQMQDPFGDLSCHCMIQKL